MDGLHTVLESRGGTSHHHIATPGRYAVVDSPRYLLKAATVWNEGQKMDAIRKAYQRAVQAPLTNVKKLWEEYTEFENNLNKQLVRLYPFTSITHAHSRLIMDRSLMTLFTPFLGKEIPI